MANQGVDLCCVVAIVTTVGLALYLGQWGFGLVYWGLTPQQQPGSYQGGEMMMMKSVFWWRKPEYPEETTDLWQGTMGDQWSVRCGHV